MDESTLDGVTNLHVETETTMYVSIPTLVTSDGPLFVYNVDFAGTTNDVKYGETISNVLNLVYLVGKSVSLSQKVVVLNSAGGKPNVCGVLTMNLEFIKYLD